ncbi:MAG: hypothetical protein JW844_07550 [Candidatus Omnitrophica bacterium]|nr:hypothetical protein [Candidatus Omnitrophota bacterium]
MKNVLSVVLVLVMSLGMVAAGYGQEEVQTASIQEFIDVAATLATTQEKIDYLLEQGQALYNSQEFQQAVNIAQYVLQYLDKDSQAAKDLLEMAQEELSAKAGETAGGLMKSLGSLGQ